MQASASCTNVALSTRQAGTARAHALSPVLQASPMSKLNPHKRASSDGRADTGAGRASEAGGRGRRGRKAKKQAAAAATVRRIRFVHVRLNRVALRVTFQVRPPGCCTLQAASGCSMASGMPRVASQCMWRGASGQVLLSARHARCTAMRRLQDGTAVRMDFGMQRCTTRLRFTQVLIAA